MLATVFFILVQAYHSLVQTVKKEMRLEMAKLLEWKSGSRTIVIGLFLNVLFGKNL